MTGKRKTKSQGKMGLGPKTIYTDVLRSSKAMKEIADKLRQFAADRRLAAKQGHGRDPKDLKAEANELERLANRIAR